MSPDEKAIGTVDTREDEKGAEAVSPAKLSEAELRLSYYRHEVNNALAVLSTNFAFVKNEMEERKLDLGEDGREAYRDMGNAIDRLKGVTQMTPSEINQKISHFKNSPSESRISLKEDAIEKGGQKIVFLIDDDVGITNALKRIVLGAWDHGKGPEVKTFASALEAKEAIESGKRPDYTICDFMMPEMTGMKYYEWLKATHPELAERITFLSGGTFDDHAEDPTIQEIRSKSMLITKPYDTKVVLGLVRSALDNK